MAAAAPSREPCGAEARRSREATVEYRVAFSASRATRKETARQWAKRGKTTYRVRAPRAAERLGRLLSGKELAVRARARAVRLVDDQQTVAERVGARLRAHAALARVHRTERDRDAAAHLGERARLERRQAHGCARRQHELGVDNLRGANLALLREVEPPTRIVRALQEHAAHVVTVVVAYVAA